MKTLLALFCAVTLAFLSVSAQSPSPAAAATGAEKKEASGQITEAERAKAVAYLKETKAELLKAVEGLSEAQWKFKAAPEKWSIAETAEHIALAEEMIWGLVNKAVQAPPTPEKTAQVAGKDEIILQKIPERSRKAQAPEQLQPSGKWATREALLKDFAKMRDAEIAYLSTTEVALRHHFAEHPVLKTMDAYQWLLFNGAHAKRHTAQIEEVKADPKFPKS